MLKLSASGAHGGGEDSASCWQGDDGASLVITDIGGIACGNQMMARVVVITELGGLHAAIRMMA